MTTNKHQTSSGQAVIPQEGMRVLTVRFIDRYPNFVLDRVGLTGTVVSVEPHLVLIQMDEPIDGCEEWNNEIQLCEDELGDFIELPTPPQALALMQRAKAEGIAVGHLYVVSRRLHPGLRGGYERGSRDMWCHYRAGESEGDRLLLQSLLVLLAHIKLQQPIPTTIDEDWEEERAAWKTAHALARAWEMPEVLPESDLEERLAEVEQLHSWHTAAGELAGFFDPFLARSAFHALVDIREQKGWNDQQFEAALWGCSEDEADNAAVLAFDRTVLRATWSIPSRTRHEGPPFGDLTLPQNRRTVSLLRSALEAAAHRRGSQGMLRSIERKWLDDPLFLHFLQVDSDQDFSSLITCCNRLLVEESPDLAANATWWVYSAEGAMKMRLYRLCIRYRPPFGRETLPSPPATCELWILFPGNEHGQKVQAAFQRYILCWLSVQEIHCEALDEGLAMLWGWLNQENDSQMQP